MNVWEIPHNFSPSSHNDVSAIVNIANKSFIWEEEKGEGWRGIKALYLSKREKGDVYTFWRPQSGHPFIGIYYLQATRNFSVRRPVFLSLFLSSLLMMDMIGEGCDTYHFHWDGEKYSSFSFFYFLFLFLYLFIGYVGKRIESLRVVFIDTCSSPYLSAEPRRKETGRGSSVGGAPRL